MRNALIATTLALAATSAHAQVVAPPVVEHAQRATSSFEVSNQGLTPLAVVLEPFSFWVDTLGEVHYAPFDSAGVQLKLSTMSVRLPPRATYAVQYEARSEKLPAWFVVTSTFAGPRTQGINVRLQLPHVVYLNQKEPLKQNEVIVHAFVYDAATKKVKFRIENVGAKLGRCNEGTVRAANGGDSQDVPSFPLFPHFVRWVELPWPSGRPPEELELKFEHFKVHVNRRTFVAKG